MQTSTLKHSDATYPRVFINWLSKTHIWCSRTMIPNILPRKTQDLLCNAQKSQWEFMVTFGRQNSKLCSSKNDLITILKSCWWDVVQNIRTFILVVWFLTKVCIYWPNTYCASEIWVLLWFFPFKFCAHSSNNMNLYRRCIYRKTHFYSRSQNNSTNNKKCSGQIESTAESTVFVKKVLWQ